jgi:hypothetical protein
VRIDRVIVAATDLDAAAARLEGEHGLRAAGGGRHEGHRTHNRIVSLGGGYLEILAVVDAAEGLMGWAVAVDDVVPVAERLGTPANTIVRQGLSAQLTGVLEAIARPCLPFFIASDPGVENPGGSGDSGGIE